jgi:hypothetical protein
VVVVPSVLQPLPVSARAARRPCPFHEDRHASLHVYETAGRGWYCFGACRRGGTIYNLAAPLYGYAARGDDFLRLRAELHHLFGLKSRAMTDAADLVRLRLSPRRTVLACYEAMRTTQDPDSLTGANTDHEDDQEAPVPARTDLPRLDFSFLRPLEGSPYLPQGHGAGAVAVSPDGRWLYVASRGAGVSVFAINNRDYTYAH